VGMVIARSVEMISSVAPNAGSGIFEHSERELDKTHGNVIRATLPALENRPANPDDAQAISRVDPMLDLVHASAVGVIFQHVIMAPAEVGSSLHSGRVLEASGPTLGGVRGRRGTRVHDARASASRSKRRRNGRLGSESDRCGLPSPAPLAGPLAFMAIPAGNSTCLVHPKRPSGNARRLTSSHSRSTCTGNPLTVSEPCGVFERW